MSQNPGSLHVEQRQPVITFDDGTRVERQWIGIADCEHCERDAEWVYSITRPGQLREHEGVYCSIRCRTVAASYRASQANTIPAPPETE